MKTLLSLLICTGTLLADDSSMQQQMEQKYQMLVNLDEQIEGIVKQMLQLEGQIAQHMQREETAIRPMVDLRQQEAIAGLKQQLQGLGAQLQQLEGQRSALLLTLKQP
ncbi:MAG: hypothetical protein FJZ58_00830 [Chlamydiae bacterium]|nr:hypothetical protein [Chlamydiota bacterium]